MKKYTGGSNIDTLNVEERKAELEGALIAIDHEIEIIRKENKNLEDTIEKYADLDLVRGLKKQQNLINHIISIILTPILIQENYIFDESGFPKKKEYITNDNINRTENNPNNSNHIIYLEGGSNSSNDELKEALIK